MKLAPTWSLNPMMTMTRITKKPFGRLGPVIALLLVMSQVLACATPIDSDGTASTTEAVAVSAATSTAVPTVITTSAVDDASEIDEITDSDEVERPAGWTEASHSNDVDPDYDVVFPQDAVNEILITIDAESWQSLLGNMEELYGEQGSGSSGRNRPGALLDTEDNEAIVATGTKTSVALTQNPGQSGGGNDGGVMDDLSENTDWVTCTITFENNTWEYVGVRFKGNSSLKSIWSSSSTKFPLKLDFDEFEDAYPTIDDQRFYGFKQLTLSPCYKDDSYLREKVAADVFRDAGVPAAYTAYYAVYVDHGDGAEYWGLYTMVEVVDDTVIETQFEDDSGNVYKPTGDGATLTEGTFNEEDFDKETNQDEADYSDIEALYAALHADTRTTDAAAWRAGLEAVFDVDEFLRYLATNTLIQNWDTYGKMSHNYYLYNDPSTGLLTWIPWDNNEAMSANSGPNGSSLSLDLDSVSDQWPLIRYLMDDPVYQAQYVADVREVAEEVFNPERMSEIYAYYAALIEPYVEQEEGSTTAFENEIEELKEQVEARYEAALVFVESQ